MDSITRRKSRKKRYIQFLPHFFRRPKQNLRKILLFTVVIGFSIGLLAFLFFYLLFLRDVPNIRDIQTSFKESSIIYDREGNELYTIYGGEENRKYVEYSGISDNIVHALVAMEDQTFFSNPGFDIFGMIRSVYDCATKRTGLCGGGSTLSQQLIKNTLLTPERTIKRKVQEIWLSWRLNSEFSKEKILELYLNKISFGSNSDGVQQASRRFFDKDASEVTVLEASVLGSLPQAPTTYNPYRRRNLLMGYVYMYDSQDPDERIILTKNSEDLQLKQAYTQIKNVFAKLEYTERGGSSMQICGVDKENIKTNVSINNDGCVRIDKRELLSFWNSIRLQINVSEPDEAETIFFIEYEVGRKDRVLMRMFDDEYISGEDLKTAFNEGIEYDFFSAREPIGHPHFVFYVREYLEQTYGEEFFQQGGWRIYTTLDPKLQDKAEEIVRTQADKNLQKFAVNNSALISLDNVTGEILAMVGSKDFYNESIDGEVNVTTSLKQPGSSFKPVIFARAFEKNSFSISTPIFDVKTVFGSYEPENYDGRFRGPMTLATALAYSRNITAVKMYYMAIQGTSDERQAEYELVEFLQNLGLTSIKHRADGYVYGASIALGTAEVSPLQFAEVFSSFANNGIYQSATPILHIIDIEGNKITPVRTKRQTLLPGAAYLVTKILSESSYRPPSWTSYLTVAGQQAATKTGTSNKRFGQRILPRDLWTIGYTPAITTVVWSGNTDGSAARSGANGLEASAPIFKQFMDFAHQDRPKLAFTRPTSVLGSGDFLYISGKQPKEIEAVNVETIEVDGLCEGVVTDATPPNSIKRGIFLEIGMPIEEQREEWKKPVLAWLNTSEGRTYLYEKFEISPDAVRFLESPENACDRPSASAPDFTTNLSDNLQLFAGVYPVEVTFSSKYPITTINILVNDVFYRSIQVPETTSGTYSAEFSVARTDGNKQEITIVVEDIYGYSSSKQYSITLLDRDTTPPVITPEDLGPIQVEMGSSVQLSGIVSDANDIVSIDFFLNGNLYGSIQNTKEYTVTLDSLSELGFGTHEVVIVAQDFQGNEATQTISIIVQ